MLTRIEISGFKSFEDFSMDLGPFMVIMGPNGAGKSNFFDAIQLLSRLATMDVRAALNGLRGEPHDLFRRQADGQPGEAITFAVEVLLNPNRKRKDQLGSEVQIRHSRIRYEVEIRRTTDERVIVTKESAVPISAEDDRWLAGIYQPSAKFVRTFIKRGRSKPLLTSETVGTASRPATCRLYQDGPQGREREVSIAEATVLSNIVNADFPHLYALREELSTYHVLQLNPVALRQPSPIIAPDEELSGNGANLPNVLHLIQELSEKSFHTEGNLQHIAAELSYIVGGNGPIDFAVVRDEWRHEYRIEFKMRHNQEYSAKVVSDGTLRVLAILTAFYQPKHWSLICAEEPENGVHPSRLEHLIASLRKLATDTKDAIAADSPLSQVLLTSHSTTVLAALREGEVVIAGMYSVVGGGKLTRTGLTFFRALTPAVASNGHGNGTGHSISIATEQILVGVGAGEG